jgi:hypothetical protein
MLFLYSVYYEVSASTCLEHYLFIFRRRCINNWYIAGVLYMLAAARTELELGQFHSNPGSSRHNTHARFQLMLCSAS